MQYHICSDSNQWRRQLFSQGWDIYWRAYCNF